MIESGLSLLNEMNEMNVSMSTYTYDKDLPKSTIKSGFGPARRLPDGSRFSYLRSKMSPRGSVIPGSVQKAFKNMGKALTSFSQFVNNISPTPKNQSTGDTIEFESNILTDTFDSNVDDAGPTTPHHNNLSQQEHATPLFPETATIIGSPKCKKAPNGDIEYLLSSIGDASGADDSMLSAIEKVWRAAGIVSHLQLQQPLPLQLYQTIDAVLDEAFPELHMHGEVLTPHHNRYSHQIWYMAKLALQEATKMMMQSADNIDRRNFLKHPPKKGILCILHGEMGHRDLMEEILCVSWLHEKSRLRDEGTNLYTPPEEKGQKPSYPFLPRGDYGHCH